MHQPAITPRLAIARPLTGNRSYAHGIALANSSDFGILLHYISNVCYERLVTFTMKH